LQFEVPVDGLPKLDPVAGLIQSAFNEHPNKSTPFARLAEARERTVRKESQSRAGIGRLSLPKISSEPEFEQGRE